MRKVVLAVLPVSALPAGCSLPGSIEPEWRPTDESERAGFPPPAGLRRPGQSYLATCNLVVNLRGPVASATVIRQK